MEILKEAEFWVAIGLLVLAAGLIWAKVPGMATKALDDRGAQIQAQLDEALRLRQEAEALLADIKIQRQAAEKTAAEMIANAVADSRAAARRSRGQGWTTRSSAANRWPNARSPAPRPRPPPRSKAAAAEPRRHRSPKRVLKSRLAGPESPIR